MFLRMSFVPAVEIEKLFLAVEVVSDDGLEQSCVPVFDSRDNEFQIIRDGWNNDKKYEMVGL